MMALAGQRRTLFPSGLRHTLSEIAKNAGPRIAPVHWAAGSDGETNFGVTLVAAPKAASSRVAIYSFTARLAVSGSRSLIHSEPGIDRCLLASAAIRLASTANSLPPTSPAEIHASTTRSKTGEKCRCHGTAHCGLARTPNGPESRLRCSSRKSKYPPAKPGALGLGPLKAAVRVGKRHLSD